MKFFCKKLLLCLMVVVILFNYVFTPKAQAVDVLEDPVAALTQGLSSVMDGILGILTWIPRACIVIIAGAVLGIMADVATIFGYVDSSGMVTNPTDHISLLTPFDIFFNKVLLTDINIFNVNVDQNGTYKDATPIANMRSQIALWYYVMRIIAISILLGIFIYIAIRMAISTVAAERAEYKKMLVNWVSSIALVFVLHYMIVLIVNLNTALVNILAGMDPGNAGLKEGISGLVFKCFDGSAIVGCCSCFLLFMIVVQTLTFLIYYIKRMLTLSFLVIISPLIAITYSIDKLGDGKAQALNAWLKEFFFTVIIQPFHCIIYLAFISIVVNLMQAAGSGVKSLAVSLLAILCLKFVWDAEKIVKKIFGIQVSESIGDAVKSAAVAGAMIKTAGKFGGKAAGVAGKTGMKLGRKFSNRINGTEKGLFGKWADSGKFGSGFAQKVHNAGQTTSRPIRELAKKAKESKLGTFASKKIAGVKTFTENHPKFKRLVNKYASNSAAVATAIMGSAGVYGSSDTNLLEAGLAGYAAFQGTKSIANRVLNKKTDRYENVVEEFIQAKAENENNEQLANMSNEDSRKYMVKELKKADRLTKEGKLTDDKLDKKSDDANEDLTDAIGDKDKADDIMEAINQGILDGNLDLKAIAQEMGLTDAAGNIDDSILRSAKVKEYIDLKNYRKIADAGAQLDEFAQEKDYHKLANNAILGTEDSTGMNAQRDDIEDSLLDVNVCVKNFGKDINDANLKNTLRDVIKDLPKFDLQNSTDVNKILNALNAVQTEINSKINNMEIKFKTNSTQPGYDPNMPQYNDVKLALNSANPGGEIRTIVKNYVNAGGPTMNKAQRVVREKYIKEYVEEVHRVKRLEETHEVVRNKIPTIPTPPTP